MEWILVLAGSGYHLAGNILRSLVAKMPAATPTRVFVCIDGVCHIAFAVTAIGVCWNWISSRVKRHIEKKKKIAYEASHTIDEYYIGLRSGGKHKFTSTSVFNILILSGFMLNLLVSSSTIHTHTQRTHRARHTASVSTTVGIYMHARYDVVFGPSMENGQIPAQKYKIKWSKVIDMW